MMKRKDETRMPRPAMKRIRGLGSTIQKERHAAVQPKAEAMEPTSVTGTRSASPSSRPMMVAMAMPKMAMEGVWNFSGTRPKTAGKVWRRAEAKSRRLEAKTVPLKDGKKPKE